jgi:hypothetical protein
MNDRTLIARVVVYGLDYFRWTQLVPMIVFWIGGLLCLAALILAATQGSHPAWLELFARWLPAGLGGKTASDPAGVDIHLTYDDVAAFSGRAWFFLSLVGTVVSRMLRGRVQYKRFQTLPGRISLAGVAALLIGAAFSSVFLWGGLDTKHAGMAVWLPFAIGMPVLLFVVSVYSLTISWVVNKIIAVFETSIAPNASSSLPR